MLMMFYNCFYFFPKKFFFVFLSSRQSTAGEKLRDRSWKFQLREGVELSSEKVESHFIIYEVGWDS